MLLGTEVGLGPGDTVLDGTQLVTVSDASLVDRDRDPGLYDT